MKLKALALFIALATPAMAQEPSNPTDTIMRGSIAVWGVHLCPATRVHSDLQSKINALFAEPGFELQKHSLAATIGKQMFDDAVQKFGVNLACRTFIEIKYLEKIGAGV